jgi:hypothetical protein
VQNDLALDDRHLANRYSYSTRQVAASPSSAPPQADIRDIAPTSQPLLPSRRHGTTSQIEWMQSRW